MMMVLLDESNSGQLIFIKYSALLEHSARTLNPKLWQKGVDAMAHSYIVIVANNSALLSMNESSEKYQVVLHTCMS